jgi:hypothetical protein
MHIQQLARLLKSGKDILWSNTTNSATTSARQKDNQSGEDGYAVPTSGYAVPQDCAADSGYAQPQDQVCLLYIVCM